MIRLFVALSGSFSCPEPWRENSRPLGHCGEKTHSKARRFLPPLVPATPPGFLFLQTIFFLQEKCGIFFLPPLFPHKKLADPAGSFSAQPCVATRGRAPESAGAAARPGLGSA